MPEGQASGAMPRSRDLTADAAGHALQVQTVVSRARERLISGSGYAGSALGLRHHRPSRVVLRQLSHHRPCLVGLRGWLGSVREAKPLLFLPLAFITGHKPGVELRVCPAGHWRTDVELCKRPGSLVQLLGACCCALDQMLPFRLGHQL